MLNDMIRRLYVHNFRCLENFEFVLEGQASALLIGKNGSGKSSIAQCLLILRRIAQGTNRIGDLVARGAFGWGRSKQPLRLEIEVEINETVYAYSLALELPEGFREPRVAEETLTVGGRELLTRTLAQVHLNEEGTLSTRFAVDWHLAALPIISERKDDAPVFVFRKWLARMLVLAPIPSLMHGESERKTQIPDVRVECFGEWFTGLLLQWPAAYTDIYSFAARLLPEFAGFENKEFSEERRSLYVEFQAGREKFVLPFEELSDGEKCVFVSALVNASFQRGSASFCFWDEPDNFLAPSEVGHFVMDLRRAAGKAGQILLTSHNLEAIKQFSDTNTFLLYRKSYLEPTRVKRLDSLETLRRDTDLVTAIALGELDPSSDGR